MPKSKRNEAKSYLFWKICWKIHQLKVVSGIPTGWGALKLQFHYINNGYIVIFVSAGWLGFMVH